MDPNCNDFNREYQEFMEGFLEATLQLFAFVTDEQLMPMPSFVRFINGIFLVQAGLIYQRHVIINSERHRDSICTYRQPSPGTSDDAPSISHSSDSMDIQLNCTMNPLEQEEQRFFSKRLSPSDPSKFLKDIKTCKESEEMRRSDAGVPGCSKWPTSAEQSGASKPGRSTRQTSAEKSGTSKPGCSKWLTSAEQAGASDPRRSTRQTSDEQSDTSKPGCSTRQTSDDEKSDTSTPGCSTRQTSAEKETSALWNFFRQEFLKTISSEPSARDYVGPESTLRPLGDETLIDSLKHKSRSEPSPGKKPEARECARELSSERWGGRIQRVESASDPQSSSFQPDSRPPPELSVSSILQIDPNDFVAPEQTAESSENAERNRQSWKELGIWDLALAELTATWERLQREKKEEAKLARQKKKEAASRAASQPELYGLRRSSRLEGQKRKTQMPKELSESSDPKTRREHDGDTSDSSD